MFHCDPSARRAIVQEGKTRPNDLTMSTYHVAMSRRISAPASVAYGIIADYRKGHPSILPPQWFKGLDVESGGVGAGTVIRFRMRAFGVTRTMRAAITEPEPGRVLVETDVESGVTTRFIVEAAGPEACTVTFDTVGTTRGGVAGAIEARLSTWLLPRVYTEELRLLDERARMSISPVLERRE